MATPDLGTTLSDAYRRGLDRLGPIAAAVIVPAFIVGASALVTGYLQTQLIAETTDDVVGSLLRGDHADLSTGDRALFNLLGALQSIIYVFVWTGTIAVVAGAMHRERHGEALSLPGPGGSLAASIGMMQRLMPKLALIAGLSVVGTLVGIVSGPLGSLVSVVAFVALVMVLVRWVYAPVIAGSGEATGDAAYDRSEETVEGSWWGTFGIFLVIALATTIPMLIVGVVIGAMLGTISPLLATFAVLAALTIGIAALSAAAVESAWHQVEGDADDTGAPSLARPSDQF